MQQTPYLRSKGRWKRDRVTDALLDLGRSRGPGIKLPTMREMCVQFDVSRTTLEAALAPLEQRGLIFHKHGVTGFDGELDHVTVRLDFGRGATGGFGVDP